MVKFKKLVIDQKPEQIIKIAISGKGGVGKNTLASCIIKVLNLQDNQYKIAAFATKIKQLIQLMFPGCNKDALYGASELRQNKIISDLNLNLDTSVSYRRVSCDIGKLGRIYNPNIWISHVDLDLKTMPTTTKLFIISDLRFMDEFQWAKDNDFMLCRIKRNEKLELNDVSETEQDNISDDQFDIIIENNGSVDGLKENILKALDKYYYNNTAYLQVRHAAR